MKSSRLVLIAGLGLVAVSLVGWLAVEKGSVVSAHGISMLSNGGQPGREASPLKVAQDQTPDGEQVQTSEQQAQQQQQQQQNQGNGNGGGQ
jgi:hypothetical protein